MKLQKKMTGKVDLILIGTAIFACLIGILFIFSATQSWDNWTKYVIVQSVGILIGIVGIFLIAKVNIEEVGKLSKYIYAFNILILALVLIIGTGGTETGTVGWIKIGSIYIQPSEISKLLLIITISYHLSVLKEKINKPVELLKLLAHFLVPVVLVLLQPDTGTAVVFMFIFVVLVFFSEIKRLYLILATSVSAVLAPLVFFILKPHQKNRILTFLHPESDQTGAGYQVLQSKITIGSGQIFGRGLFNGPQTQFGSVPAKHTDFIFTVIGEEWGLIGCIIAIILILIIVFRCLQIAKMSKNTFSKYMCIGIVAMLFFHAFENIGMTLGLMPVTGIPLPFFSYGGTSIVTYLLSLGIVSNVSINKTEISFSTSR